MKMKKTLLALTIITSVFTINVMAAEQESVKQEFDPSKAEIIDLNQLDTPRALNSEGGIDALASAGAWTDVVYNPNVTQAGSWVMGPLMSAPAGTSSSAIVQNLTNPHEI